MKYRTLGRTGIRSAPTVWARSLPRRQAVRTNGLDDASFLFHRSLSKKKFSEVRGALLRLRRQSELSLAVTLPPIKLANWTIC